MMHSYTAAGAKLAYRVVGEGEPIVFLHPTPLDGRYWLPLIDRLSGVRAILPDFRGHGASSLGDGLPVGQFKRVPDAPVLTMAQLAIDVIAMLYELKVERAVFVGCSIGGYVLLELWRQIPARMKGLAFVCSKPQPDAETNLVKRVATITQAREEGVNGIFAAQAKSLVGATAQSKRPAIVDEVRAQMTLTAEAVVATQAGLATRPDSLATVRTIHVPVLAIAGGQDGAVTAAEMEAFKTAPGECSYHLLADAGHFAAYEQPDKVAELLSGWLDRVR